jgi:hypothetical protein
MFENELPVEAPEQAPAESAPADPYDGVALGVECAWPAEFQL